MFCFASHSPAKSSEGCEILGSLDHFGRHIAVQNHRIVFDQCTAMFIIAPNTSCSRISGRSSENASKEVKRLPNPKFLIDFRDTVSLNTRNEQDDQKTFSSKTR